MPRYLSIASDTSASLARSRLASTALTARLQNAPYRFSRGLCIRCTESEACIVTLAGLARLRWCVPGGPDDYRDAAGGVSGPMKTKAGRISSRPFGSYTFNAGLQGGNVE